jgi:hypothetical protein
MSEIPDQLTKAEKKRLCLAWLSGGVFWVAIANILSHVLQHDFPNIETETVTIILLTVGAPLSILLALLFYRLVLVKTIRDSE